MRREKLLLDAAGLGVVLIGLGTPEEAHAFRVSQNLPFPVLSDSAEDTYHQFGLGRAASQGMTVADARALARAIIRHGGAVSRNQNMAQLGGTIIVDQTGAIVFIHRSDRISNNSRPAVLIAALASGTNLNQSCAEPE